MIKTFGFVIGGFVLCVLLADGYIPIPVFVIGIFFLTAVYSPKEDD